MSSGAPERVELGALHSVRHLGHILGFAPEVLKAVAALAESYYCPFDDRQIRNGRLKVRRIDNPRGVLKKIQGRINRRLLATRLFPDEIVGGVKGRSPRTNAQPHLRQTDVVTMDIENFFGTVKARAVARAWRDAFATGNEVTWLLTRLTTYEGHLPQGAPTSSALANLVLLPIASELAAYCRSLGLRFTVYVDDITVSGDGARNAIQYITRVVGRHGFRVARRKTALMRSGARQTVTGIVVNRKLSVGNARIKALRREAIEAHQRGDSNALIKLRGRVAHATSVSCSQGTSLGRLVERLQDPSPSAA